MEEKDKKEVPENETEVQENEIEISYLLDVLKKANVNSDVFENIKKALIDFVEKLKDLKDKWIEEWKDKNLKQIVDDEVQSIKKEEEIQKREDLLKEKEKQLEEQEKILNKKMQYNELAFDKGITKEMLKFVYCDGMEEEKILENINIIDKFIGKVLEEYLKENAAKPSGNGTEKVSQSMWDEENN